jgi:hypothetical protein
LRSRGSGEARRGHLKRLAARPDIEIAGVADAVIAAARVNAAP